MRVTTTLHSLLQWLGDRSEGLSRLELVDSLCKKSSFCLSPREICNFLERLAIDKLVTDTLYPTKEGKELLLELEDRPIPRATRINRSIAQLFILKQCTNPYIYSLSRLLQKKGICTTQSDIWVKCSLKKILNWEFADEHVSKYHRLVDDDRTILVSSYLIKDTSYLSSFLFSEDTRIRQEAKRKLDEIYLDKECRLKYKLAPGDLVFEKARDKYFVYNRSSKVIKVCQESAISRLSTYYRLPV